MARMMILKNTFVDDVIGGEREKKEAEEFANQAMEIAAAANMKIKRWQTNNPILQSQLDQKESGITSEEKPNIFSLLESSLEVLGSVWERSEDILTFENSALDDYCYSLRHRTYLRTALSTSARVYDVLGLILPMTITAHILM